jgi:hypothetical protein
MRRYPPYSIYCAGFIGEVALKQTGNFQGDIREYDSLIGGRNRSACKKLSINYLSWMKRWEPELLALFDPAKRQAAGQPLKSQV